MIRELFAAAAIAGAAVALAPVAAADGGDNMYFDQPGHYATDVPGMNYDAHLNAPCDNMDFFTFGRGPITRRAPPAVPRPAGLAARLLHSRGLLSRLMLWRLDALHNPGALRATVVWLRYARSVALGGVPNACL